MKIPMPVRHGFYFGLLFVPLTLQFGLAQSTNKIPEREALTSGRVQNNTYINDSLGLQFTPPPGLAFGAPELKGKPGTVPLLVTVAAWGDGGAVFCADDLGYYPQDRRSTQTYVELVIRNQKKSRDWIWPEDSRKGNSEPLLLQEQTFTRPYPMRRSL